MLRFCAWIWPKCQIFFFHCVRTLKVCKDWHGRTGGAATALPVQEKGRLPLIEEQVIAKRGHGDVVFLFFNFYFCFFGGEVRVEETHRRTEK